MVRPPDAVARLPTAEDSGSDELEDDPMGARWEGVDLDALRAALPRNLYWTHAVPTDDPQVLEERAKERERWKVEYGKILSGTATEEEILAYYDQRAELSGDYIELATYLIDRHGESLPERDLDLLHLARRLHHARLEETPRKIEEAMQRKRAQDASRPPWRADEAGLATTQSPPAAE
jgi:hypothetical protein